MPAWSKMRIREGGDRIQTAQSFKRFNESRRNNTFVRYEVELAIEDEPTEVIAIQYGRLERILVCGLGPQTIWKKLRHSVLLLAVITPAKTNGEDAALTTTQFSNFGVSIVTDLRNVKASIGTVETRKCWGIIDRAVGTAKTAFVFDQGDHEPTGSEDEEEDPEDPGSDFGMA
ncbi:hypothetical protein JVU11DRAFT_9159 [Chiua virens]|nr:hypothetical protein JVU11DRAFT_9159 [Chiua virens]